MMLAITVIKRIAADTKSQQDHPGFKKYVVNNVDPEKWQTREE
jgi:hypothetical protein